MAGSWNHFPQVAQKLREALRDIVVETAQQVEQEAKSGAPVDTGFLRDAIYSNTVQGSTYGQASPTHKDSYLLDEAGPATDDTAYVGAAANYSIYLELGTRFQPPQPFFYPACDAGGQVLQDKLDDIESRL